MPKLDGFKPSSLGHDTDAMESAKRFIVLTYRVICRRNTGLRLVRQADILSAYLFARSGVQLRWAHRLEKSGSSCHSPRGFRFTSSSLHRFAIPTLAPRPEESGRRPPHSKSWRASEPVFKFASSGALGINMPRRLRCPSAIELSISINHQTSTVSLGFLPSSLGGTSRVRLATGPDQGAAQFSGWEQWLCYRSQ